MSLESIKKQQIKSSLGIPKKYQCYETWHPHLSNKIWLTVHTLALITTRRWHRQHQEREVGMSGGGVANRPMGELVTCGVGDPLPRAKPSVHPQAWACAHVVPCDYFLCDILPGVNFNCFSSYLLYRDLEWLIQGLEFWDIGYCAVRVVICTFWG